jgi:hypothetical protein
MTAERVGCSEPIAEEIGGSDADFISQGKRPNCRENNTGDNYVRNQNQNERTRRRALLRADASAPH